MLLSPPLQANDVMMVGGLALHQPQHLLPPPPPRRPSEHRLREQPLPWPPPSLEEFKQVHAQFVKLTDPRRTDGELLSACALCQWGNTNYARSIFATINNPTSFHFNTMIRAYVRDCNPEAALLLYREMQERGVRPDHFTFPFALKACARISAIRDGTQIHCQAIKLGFAHDVFVQNSLINMYGKCREIDVSCSVFDQMGSGRTIASWSSLLAAHSRMGLWSECLKLFSTMTGKGMRPDESSIASALSSCAHLGAFDIGRSIHCLLLRNTSGVNLIVQTSLIEMYAKCGCLELGLVIFERITEKNAWTYSVMISGLAMHGDGKTALQTFSDMIRKGLQPDEVVYVGVLSACSHAGLLEEGLHYFDRMRLEHQITPTPQHYGCMVDLMCRAGKVEQAYKLISSMAIGSRDAAWRCLLNACKVHRNLELAELASRNILQPNAGDYVVLSNMCAKAQRWDEAARMRVEMIDRGLLQEPGYSRVEVRGRMHTFFSQDRSQPRSNEVYEMLYQMEWQLRFECYSPDTSQVLLLDVDEEEKRRILRGHSQKLAIAFGLMRTSSGTRIRIITNLSMSGECHTYTGLISKIFDREIVVRDRNRFHRFSQGVCSCGDYW